MNQKNIELRTKVNDRELTVDELENAAGGFFVSGGAFLAWSIAYSCVSIASAYSLGRMGY